ncbi:MAG TPA: DUF2171 domain-containing protein, partial [bacterium]|nr:DUF2171 domain-containing protein [bacterium]
SAGMPVIASDGTLVGHVTHVLGDSGRDIFDGVSFRRHLLGPHRMVSYAMIGRITDRAVYLNVATPAAEACPAYQEEQVYQIGQTGLFRHHLGWRGRGGE